MKILKAEQADFSTQRGFDITDLLLSTQRLHYTDPTASQLAEDADDTLFKNILADPQHVLHHLLPSRTHHSYKLRPRRHNCSLTVKPDAINFITRQLFKDMYVLIYINLFKTYFTIVHCCVLSTFQPEMWRWFTWSVTSQRFTGPTAETTVVFDVAIVRLQLSLTRWYSVFTWTLTCRHHHIAVLIIYDKLTTWWTFSPALN